MTSVLTNIAAQSAIHTLKSIAGRREETQGQVSTGLRVATATDNASYWSIATTMRSDDMALFAVQDAITFGAAKVDTAYAGITAVADILKQFQAKLVAAMESGVDKAKIQEELEQLKSQVVSIAQSSSFNGVNWLDTAVSDINDSDLNRVSLVTGFNRLNGQVSVERAEFHLSEISLFNENGGGLLQADTRKLQTLGGIRIADTYMDHLGEIHTWPENVTPGRAGTFSFDFAGPLIFDVDDFISFDITVDADNPLQVPAPHHPGKTTPVVIDRALVDSTFPSANGVIASFTDFTRLLSRALSVGNTGAYSNNTSNGTGGLIPNRINVTSYENSGLNGSSVQIQNFSQSLTSGLGNQPFSPGNKGIERLWFTPFEVFADGNNPDGVEVIFRFGVNGQPETLHKFDRTYVNDLLGKTTGKIETQTEMVTLLRSLISPQWPDVIIEADGPTYINVHSNSAIDRLNGRKTYTGFTGISVSIEPISEQNFLDIDIVARPERLGTYMGYIDVVTSEVISAAAALGALRSRLDMQADFTKSLSESVQRGIGRLVDADMNEASTRLKALQTQEQLAIRSLSIANSSAEGILSLFQ